LAFICYNKLTCYNKLKFIKVHKDILPVSLRSNVVYQINCSDCDASYVGQIKRTLNTRVNEHKSHIRRNSTQLSVITDHRLKSKHDFDWDNVKFLTQNPIIISASFPRRFIKKQKRGLNAQTDTALLDPVYNDLFDFMISVSFLPFMYYLRLHVKRTLFIYSYFVFYRNDTVSLILFYLINFVHAGFSPNFGKFPHSIL